MRNRGHLLPILVNYITEVDSDFSRESNGINIKDIQNHADQSSLRTATRKTFRRGAAVPESQDHFPILKVAEDQSEKPLGDFKGNEDSHDDIMVDFVEGFGPVSHQIDDCCRLAGVVCLLENEVDDRDESM